MKRCLISTAREIQIKFMRNHLTPIRIALTEKKKRGKDKKCEEAGTIVHYWWGYKVVQPLWKAVCWFLKKFKNKIACDLAIILLNYVQKGLK